MPRYLPSLRSSKKKNQSQRALPPPEQTSSFVSLEEMPKRVTETSAGAAGVHDPKRLAIQEDPLKEEKDNLKRQIEKLTSDAAAKTGIDRYSDLVLIARVEWKLAKLEFPNDLIQLQAARKALVDAEVRHEREVEEDKWAKKIAGLKVDLKEADESFKETYRNDLAEALLQKKEWEKSWPTREIELRQKFEATYAMPSSIQPFRLRVPPPNLRETIDFIETDQYHQIRNEVSRLCKIPLPTTNLRGFHYCVVRGPMGVGKTLTTWKAISSIEGVIQGYARLDDFILAIPSMKSETLAPTEMLAALLMNIFTGAPAFDIPLAIVAERILQLKKGRIIVLHVDEVQVNAAVASKILYGCKVTLTSDHEVSVIPVFSGVHALFDDLLISEVSNWTSIGVRIRTLPRTQLERNVSKALEMDLEKFKATKNCQILLNDCGNLAYLVVDIVEAIKKQPRIWKKLKENDEFVEEDAKVIFQSALVVVEGVYGASRWHGIVSRSWKRNDDDDPTKRDSWQQKTVKLVQRVALLAFSRRPISPSMELIPGVTVEKCRDAGLFDLQMDRSNAASSNTMTVYVPLLAMAIMNRICHLIPASLELENPFGDDWQTLERVAMASLLIQLQVEPKRSLKDLRPGAIFYCKASVVEIFCPEKIDFYYLGTYLEGERLKRGKNADGGEVSLKVGDIAITAPNQFAHDGIAIIAGEIDGKPCIVLWFSQTKAQDGIDRKSGEPTASSLYDGTIENVIIPRQRRGVEQFKERFPEYKDAFVVFDVFSNRNPPVGGPGDYSLKENEAIFVTRNDTLDSVLGGLSARKREIVDK